MISTDDRTDDRTAGQCAPDKKAKDVKATMHFLPRITLWDEEKPYHVRYSPHGNIPATNVFPTTVNNVHVRDLRPVLSSLTLDTDGVVVKVFDSKMTYEDFSDPAVVTGIYLTELLSLLKRMMKTENVAVLEYVIRRRHPSFPLSLDKEFDYVQPVAAAHVDFSPDCLRQILEDRCGEAADKIMENRYQLITIWKPLKGPLCDWPLSVCIRSSVDESDLVLMDRVYPDHIEESISVHHSPMQDWVYLSDQMPNELLMFSGGDSNLGIKGGLPHCAFQLPNTSPVTTTRESIEVRFIVSNSDSLVDLKRKRPSTRHGPYSNS